MTETTDKPAIPRKTGMTHGIRAYIDSGKLPSGRAYRRAVKEISLIRNRLVAKYGGDKIEPDVLVMIESAAKSMMVQELCSLYIKRAGILRRDSLNDGNLELHSVLARSYVSYANLTRLSLEAAARLAGIRIELNEPDVLTYIKAFDAQKEKAAQEPAIDGRDSGQGQTPVVEVGDSGSSENSGADGPGGGNVEGKEDDQGKGIN